MREYQSLSHVRWECKRHIVFAPKYRKSPSESATAWGSQVLTLHPRKNIIK